MMYLRPGNPPMLGGDPAVPGVYGSYPRTAFVIGAGTGAVLGTILSAKVARPSHKIAATAVGTTVGPIIAGIIADMYDVGFTKALAQARAIWIDGDSRYYLYSIAGMGLYTAIAGPFIEDVYADLKTRKNGKRRGKKARR
jgi:hypothetical protein